MMKLSKNGISFSVEEYKRPTFFVGYDTLKESYKIGDTIKLHGFAKAYAGYPMDGADFNLSRIQGNPIPLSLVVSVLSIQFRRWRLRMVSH